MAAQLVKCNVNVTIVFENTKKKLLTKNIQMDIMHT